MNYRNSKAHYSSDSSENSSNDNLNGNFEFNYIPSNEESIMDQASSPIDFPSRSNHVNTDQQSRRSSTSTNSYFSMKHSLTLLPTFNGTNIPVHQFTSDCKGVSDLVEPDERIFFFRAVLQTKLTGDAALIRSIYTITNLDELCSALIKEFGNYKTFDQWELELNNLRQNRDESIEKYITKVRKLNSEMIIAISNYPDQTARAGLRVFATNKLIDHFVGGLHRHIGHHLLAQKFNTLEDAIESIVRFIRKSQYHTERFRTNKFNQSNHITCNYCKKFDHSESECRKKIFHMQNQNGSANSNFQNSNYNRREFNPMQSFGNGSGNGSNAQTNNQQVNNRQDYNNRYSQNNSSNNYHYNNTNNGQSNQNRYNNTNNGQSNQNRYNNTNNGQFNLNYQGQARSAQRPGQISSRANPVQLMETESEHTQSDPLPEMSSLSLLPNSETQETNSY